MGKMIPMNARTIVTLIVTSMTIEGSGGGFAPVIDRADIEPLDPMFPLIYTCLGGFIYGVPYQFY